MSRWRLQEGVARLRARTCVNFSAGLTETAETRSTHNNPARTTTCLLHSVALKNIYYYRSHYLHQSDHQYRKYTQLSVALSGVQQRSTCAAAAAAAPYRLRFPVYIPHVSAAVLSASLSGLLIGRRAGPMRERVTKRLDLPATRVCLINSQTLTLCRGMGSSASVGVVFKNIGSDGQMHELIHDRRLLTAVHYVHLWHKEARALHGLRAGKQTNFSTPQPHDYL